MVRSSPSWQSHNPRRTGACSCRSTPTSTAPVGNGQAAGASTTGFGTPTWQRVPSTRSGSFFRRRRGRGIQLPGALPPALKRLLRAEVASRLGFLQDSGGLLRLVPEQERGGRDPHLGARMAKKGGEPIATSVSVLVYQRMPRSDAPVMVPVGDGNIIPIQGLPLSQTVFREPVDQFHDGLAQGAPPAKTILRI